MRRHGKRSTYSGLGRGPVFAQLAVAVLLVGGVVATAAAPASATPQWQVVASPSPVGPPSGILSSVSCPVATRCFAVGQYSDGPMLKTLVERFNGTNWSIATSPNPSGGYSFLSGVSCPSATSCFAVGQYRDPSSFAKTLVERWNGASWSIVTSPNPPGETEGIDAMLSGVSCPSATDCFAVGNWSTDQGTHTIPLVERWNGTSWSVAVSTNRSGATDGVLSSVSCPSATSCFAVGQDEAGSVVGHTLVERWNGTSWSSMASPDPVVATNFALYGVSCSSATSCFAVGGYFDGSTFETLVERLDGKTWSIVASVNPSSDNVLSGVSCLSATRCYAVGSYTNGPTTPGRTLTERWNGTSWSILPSPSQISSGLSGVSCVPGSCYAVGSGDSSTLVEHWDSANWSIAPPPVASSQSQLAQVSCPSVTSCFAVGSYSDAKSTNTLVERWNGTSWSVVPSPNPTGAGGVLRGVSCASPTSCDAVGDSFNGSATKTLVERWNGTSWSIVASPNPAGASGAANGSRLTGVSCPSATSCFAVGNYSNGSDHKTLVERWNGTSWSIGTSPNPTGGQSFLNGVSCPTTTNCFAVGAANFSGKTLVEQWNGTSWSIVTSPDPTGPASLSSVSCPGTASCFAVGGFMDDLTDSNTTLVEQWNGTSWSIVTSPNPTGTEFTSLNGVSCPSATSCDAVGSYSTGPTPTAFNTLTEHWNGTNWSVVTSPDPMGATEVTLSGVACPSATRCYAVGNYFAQPAQYTLIERDT